MLQNIEFALTNEIVTTSGHSLFFKLMVIKMAVEDTLIGRIIKMLSNKMRKQIISIILCQNDETSVANAEMF